MIFFPTTGVILRQVQYHGPLTRYIKLRVALAPGMPGKFSPPPTSNETAGYRDARAVMHVGIVNPRFLGKRSRHSRRMRNPQFYVSGKRPIETTRIHGLHKSTRHWYDHSKPKAQHSSINVSCTQHVFIYVYPGMLNELYWFIWKHQWISKCSHGYWKRTIMIKT